MRLAPHPARAASRALFRKLPKDRWPATPATSGRLPLPAAPTQVSNVDASWGTGGYDDEGVTQSAVTADDWGGEAWPEAEDLDHSSAAAPPSVEPAPVGDAVVGGGEVTPVVAINVCDSAEAADDALPWSGDDGADDAMPW